jgi:hypothetical protein
MKLIAADLDFHVQLEKVLNGQPNLTVEMPADLEMGHL